MNVEHLIEELSLKRVKIRGNEIHASCPFSERHLFGKDSHPSFSINIDKGVYNCFSCGIKGTLENLVSRIKGISESDAVDWLESNSFSKFQRELRDKKIHEIPEIIPDGLLFYFDKVDNDYAEVYSGEVDNIDCFIYPVRNIDGNLVGAMARSKKDKFHKIMWNMKKKLYLYGEDKVDKEKQLVIVEGPGDVIALRKSGLTNVVALMGITVSNEQAEKLLYLSSEFVIWLDRDRAGAKGMKGLFKKLENRAYVLYVYPWKQVPKDCKDPKDVYEKYGTEKVKEIVLNSKTYIEYIMEDNCGI